MANRTAQTEVTPQTTPQTEETDNAQNPTNAGAPTRLESDANMPEVDFTPSSSVNLPSGFVQVSSGGAGRSTANLPTDKPYAVCIGKDGKSIRLNARAAKLAPFTHAYVMGYSAPKRCGLLVPAAHKSVGSNNAVQAKNGNVETACGAMLAQMRADGITATGFMVTAQDGGLRLTPDID